MVFFNLFAQLHSSYPILKNFERSEYDAGMQTWMISQAPNDLMYFANNYGLLEFDGHNWELYGLQNYTVVRSVLATENGKTYVGLSNSFGYFITDSTGRQQFYSLNHLLPPEKQNLEEIWRIHETSDGIVFQSYKELIVYKNNELKVYDAPNGFFLSYKINNKLYVVDLEEGIFEFKNGKLFFLKGTKNFAKSEISSILPYGKDLMIATTGHGVFLYRNKKMEQWKGSVNDYLVDNQIYSALRIDENRIAFGTIQKGLLICDNEGFPLLKMDKSNGLQNNTILSMMLDKSGNLWLGTNNGIDLLYINSPIRQLGLKQGIGSGYTSVIHNNILYLGTNQGLYYKSLNNPSVSEFTLIERLKGQVWNLQVVDNLVFCGHNKGTYIVNKGQVEKIGNVPGAWKYLQSEKYPDKIIGGTYTGLILLQKIKGKWVSIKKLSGFNESSRMMYFDRDENIWMSHGFKGVYFIKLSEALDSILDTRLYNSNKGFKNDFGINIARLQDQIVFLTTDGAYRYNEKKDSIEPSVYFNTFFENKEANYAIQDIYGNIWYYGDYSLGAKLIKNDGRYTDVSMPFKQLRGSFIEGFQNIYAINENNFLISNEDGFMNYNKAQLVNKEKPFNLYLNRVELLKTDSIIYKGHLFENNNNNIPSFNFKNNSLQFYFSAVHFENPYKVEFSSFLEGYDTEWTNWQSDYDREFTNLTEGEYAFYIKARNVHNIETPAVIYKFNVLPPWFRTSMAYFLYVLSAIFLVALVVFLIHRRIAMLKEKEKDHQKQKFIEREKELNKETLIAEKEIIRLRNEQLRDTLKTKDKELANSTMDTIKKNKFLIGLKSDMQKNNKEMKSETAKTNNKRLIRKIDNEINNEKNWQVFETHFGNVHEEFLNKLKQEYPQISPAELRLCACLRMNISSKEIASLLNISIRGVEAGRYRLRKALDLDRQTNLTDFILSF